ncbi:maleylpyruvate isomerase N-terminal domain-containing protein [Actinophytocola oryzae]|uniref:Maleylpyruvate isomerase n=1 Tax=Actinophytocola oryzae TaxID=502181 RepID=A0A4R7V5B7_9PSEU|nr:maleylpyruvate isomerase N-terminal domain-containing protein [Actinophytocola oryzae]TDV42706.1 maleylpyruvate isomerase [Actinophytocola oryzae]
MSISPEASVEQNGVPARRRVGQWPAAERAVRLLPLVREATERLDLIVAGLDDDTIHQPSRLPGWSRAHVVTHLARNADALVNLLTWARTGVEHPMYASRADRDADIDEGADRLAQILREDLRAAGARFLVAATEQPERAWTATVAARMQGAISASEVPSMRLFELWVHLVDLGVDFTFDDVPAHHLEALVAGAVSPHSGRPDWPVMRLTAELPGDRTHTVDLTGGRGDDRTYELAGPAPDVVAWLTGRGDGTALRGDVPVLPAWG